MDATVIDTLRFADRLKEAGVESRQAEAMSRALNDELAGGVATKEDLGRAVDELKDDIARVDAKIDVLDAKCESRFAAMDTRLESMDAKLEAMDARFDAKVDAIDAKFGSMDAKFEARFDAIATQSRHVFLVLAVIAALGLYNAVAPHFAARGTADPATTPAAPMSAPAT